MWLVDCMEIALSAVNKIFMSNKMEIGLTLGSAISMQSTSHIV